MAFDLFALFRNAASNKLLPECRSLSELSLIFNDVSVALRYSITYIFQPGFDLPENIHVPNHSYLWDNRNKLAIRAHRHRRDRSHPDQMGNVSYGFSLNFKNALKISGNDNNIIALLGNSYALSGKKTEALKIIATLIAQSKQN